MGLVNTINVNEKGLTKTEVKLAIEKNREEIAKVILRALGDLTQSVENKSLQADNDRLEAIDVLHRRVIPRIGCAQGKQFKVLDLDERIHLSSEARLSKDSPNLGELRGTAAMVSQAMMASEKFVLFIEKEGFLCGRHPVLKAQYILDTYRDG